MPLAIEVAFLSNVVARLTLKYQNLYLRVVWLIKNNNIFIINYTYSNTIHAIFLLVMLDFGAQLVMIYKWLS